MKKGTIILITMLATAAVAIGFGLYVMQQRINTPPPNQTQDNSSQTPDQQAQGEIPVVPTPSTVGWKTYTNDKHGFTVMYPPYLKAGAVSDNSVLGTYSVPVRGLHVGPLVLVALEDKSLQKDALSYFNTYYDQALHPQTQTPSSEGPGPVVCTIDKITNPNAVGVKSVTCNGEGGAAKYAYLTGQSYDVFVDGYSKGFDNSGSGDLTSDIDYTTILSTFIFTKDLVSANTNNPPIPNPTPTPNPTPNPNPTPTPTPNPTPTIKSFTISADDSGATPSTISVAPGTIVEITFNVSSSNVYYGGLDFRSSVVNSGTVYAGQSRTISFTANNSFQFTPYWPASQVAKNYKISVTVQ